MSDRSGSLNDRLFNLLNVNLLYLALLLLFFYPFVFNISGSLIGPPEDNMQDFWNTWFGQVAIDNGLSNLFTTDLIFFPEGASLWLHSLSYTNIFLIYGIRELLSLPDSTRVLVICHNGVLLLSVHLSAVGAYLLIRYLTGSNLAAATGGFIFGFSPHHYANLLHHTHVATIQFIPFFVLYTLKYFDSGTRRYFLGAVIFCALSALSSWYFLVYNLLFTAFYALWRTLVTKRSAWRQFLLTAISISGATCLLLSPLLYQMMVQSFDNSPGGAYVTGHNRYVADLAAYVVFHPYHLLHTFVSSINEMLKGNDWEKSVYLGWVNFSLLLWYACFRADQKPEIFSLAIWGMTFFMLFSFGTYLHFLGYELPIPMPTAITEHLPLLGNLRTPSRAVVYVYLFLAIIVGLALNHLSGKTRLRFVVPALIFLIVLDFYPARREMTPVAIPPGYGYIQALDESGFGILNLPSGYIANNAYMMFQTIHGLPIVNGQTSRDVQDTLIDRLEMRNLALQQEQLTAAGVRFIVLNKTDEVTMLKPRAERVEAYVQHYTTVFEDATTIVFDTSIIRPLH